MSSPNRRMDTKTTEWLSYQTSGKALSQALFHIHKNHLKLGLFHFTDEGTETQKV